MDWINIKDEIKLEHDCEVLLALKCEGINSTVNEKAYYDKKIKSFHGEKDAFFQTSIYCSFNDFVNIKTTDMSVMDNIEKLKNCTPEYRTIIAYAIITEPNFNN